MWSGTQKGVEQIELDVSNAIVSTQYFGKSDGFTSIETVQNVISTDPFGNVWFGTISGLTKYEPAINKEHNFSPIIHFETVDVAYKPIDSIQNYSVSNLLLSPNENNLSFSYKTIAVDAPNEIEYRYQLNDGNWSGWSKNNSVVFANQSPGEYQFKAQSKIITKLIN